MNAVKCWAPVLVSLGFLGAGRTDDITTAEIISRLGTAGPQERPVLVHQLSVAGPGALAETRKARDALADGELRLDLSRAATWQLARKLSPRLLEGYESQLTYAGQHAEVRSEGPEVIDALLVLIDDASTDMRVRLSACRALADAVDPKIDQPGIDLTPERKSRALSSLRKLYHDVLLSAILREQVGILLAILGDTQAVDSEIGRLERLASSDNEVESAQSHLQLANLYYRIRNYEKAVKSYDRIVAFYERFVSLQKRRRARPEVLQELSKELALHYYNAACSSALNKDLEKSKALLRKAVDLNPSNLENVEKDGDLLYLRSDASFPSFREELGKKALDGSRP